MKIFKKKIAGLLAAVMTLASSGFTAFAAEGDVVTKYGTVPAEWADKSFAAFCEGEFLGAYDVLYAASSTTSGQLSGTGMIPAVKAYMKNNPMSTTDGTPLEDSKDVEIVMLKDAYAHDKKTTGYSNLSQVRGRIVLDLNQNTITAQNTILPGTAKAWGTAPAKPYVYETNITIKNGNVLLDNANLVYYWNQKYTSDYKKHMVFNFEDLNISLVEGHAKPDLILKRELNDYGAIFDFNFKNCTFDVRNAAAETPYELFNAAHTKTSVEINYTVEGGNIIANDMDSVKIVNIDGVPNATIKVSADEKTGLYPTITLPEAATAPGEVAFGDTVLSYEKYKTTSDGSVVYACAADVETEYGTIPAEYADKTFVAFCDCGKVLASDTLYESDSSIYTLSKAHIKTNPVNTDGTLAEGADEIKVLMRKDYTTTTADAYSNFAQLRGHLILDLDGHTLTQANGKEVFPAQAKPWGAVTPAVFDTHITMKNGKVKIDDSYLINYSTWGENDAVKRYIFDFEGIDFTATGASKNSCLINCNSNDNETLSAKYDISFDGCSFDLTNVAKNFTLFGTNHTKSNITVNYSVTGGSIKADDMSMVTLASLGTNASIECKSDKTTGLYFTINLPETASAPGDVTLGNTVLGYEKYETTADGRVVYACAGKGVETKYGTVPVTWEDKSFAAFSGGEFLGAYDALYESTSTKSGQLAGAGMIPAVKAYMDDNPINEDGSPAEGSKEVQIIMLKDANAFGEGASNYNNLAQIVGRLVLDLNGNTITNTSGKTIWPGTAKAWGVVTPAVFETNITMKNGNVLLNNSPLMYYYSSAYEHSYKKHMVFSFEDLNFSLVEGHTYSTLVNGSGGDKEPGSIFDISFKNCSFDVRNATKIPYRLFNATHTLDGLVLNYKVEGSKVIAKNEAAVNICSLDADSSTIEYVKAADTGDYLTLTLPADASVPETFYDVNGETMHYTRYTEDEDGNVLYKLSIPTEYEILDYDTDNKSAKVVIAEDGEYTVVFAKYDGDALAAVDVVEKALGTGVETISQELDFVADEVILMDGFDTMTPLCKPLKVMLVMAIGNSFAQDAVTYLDDIAKADGVKLEAYNMYIECGQLKEHHEALNDEAILYDLHKNGVDTNNDMSISDVARMKDWDYVMLQGTTHNGPYDEMFFGRNNQTDEEIDAAPVWTDFKDKLQELAPDAKRLVHATWSQYDETAAVFGSRKFAAGVPDSRGAMTTKILERAQLGADIYSTEKRADGQGVYIPTAVAVDYLIRHYGFPEYERVNGKLSNAQDTRGVYRADTGHLTDNIGRVLAGMVWYEMLTGNPATENKYRRITISDEDMEKIKAAAHYACENYMSYDLSTAECSVDRGGLIFDRDERFGTQKPLSAIPQTIEAKVIAKTSKSRNGVIAGTYIDDNTPGLWFEIYNGGYPRLLIINDNLEKSDYQFKNIDARTDDWIHIAITQDYEARKVRCYIDGELKQTLDMKANHPTAITHTKELRIGGDHREGNVQCFLGRIKNVGIYSDVRTADEIAADSKVTTPDTDGLMAGYDLSVYDMHNPPKSIPDLSSNGMDLSYIEVEFDFSPDEWLDEAPLEEEYAYSFALVGDTQYPCEYWPERFEGIYDWLVENAEDKKIKWVFGLGDITQSSTRREWETAQVNITKLDGVVPYSIARGNHDGAAKPDEYFKDSWFAKNTEGRYDQNSITNVYHTLKAGEIDYLILSLDWSPTDAELKWADGIVEQYPNHNVIVVTHGYLAADGSLLNETSISASVAPSVIGSNPKANNGDDMWEKFVKKHKNIKMVLCGHTAPNKTVVTTLVGDNGNTVTQVLADFTGLEKRTFGAGGSVVVMLYFSEDGSKAQVRTYSTAADKYYKSTNQFSIEIETAEAAQ